MILARRLIPVLIITASAIFGFTFVYFFRNVDNGPPGYYDGTVAPVHEVEVSKEVLAGETIMPKLGNETAKYATSRDRKPTQDTDTGLPGPN